MLQVPVEPVVEGQRTKLRRALHPSAPEPHQRQVSLRE